MRSSWSSAGQSSGAAMKAPPIEVEKIAMPRATETTSKKTPQQMRISQSSAGQLSGAAMKAPLREVEKIAPLRTIEPCGITAVAVDEWVGI